MGMPAAKGASYVITAGISWISQKKYAAMPASFQAFS
jgi:hypothetical protein